jgi:hypothetical protein
MTASSPPLRLIQTTALRIVPSGFSVEMTA